MTLDLFLLQLFTGLALGSIYVLLALGLSLIFGLLNIVNFAHGQFFMLGAYVGAFALGLAGTSGSRSSPCRSSSALSGCSPSASSCARSTGAASTTRCSSPMGSGSSSSTACASSPAPRGCRSRRRPS